MRNRVLLIQGVSVGLGRIPENCSGGHTHTQLPNNVKLNTVTGIERTVLVPPVI